MNSVIDILEKLKSPGHAHYIKVYSYVNRNQTEDAIEYIQRAFQCERGIAEISLDEFKKYCNERDELRTWRNDYNEYNQNNRSVPRCPYCQSTNLKKISTTSRIVSTGLFGLGSSKIGKQWHCNNCKSDF